MNLLKLKGNIFYCFIMMLSFYACDYNSKIDISLNKWIFESCCKSDSSQFSIADFTIDEGKIIEIHLCENEYLNQRLQISMSYKEKDGTYKSLFDLASTKKIDNFLRFSLDTAPLGFIGSFSPHNLIPDGYYRLYLAGNDKCGEIRFYIKNGKKEDQKYVCVRECAPIDQTFSEE